MKLCRILWQGNIFLNKKCLGKTGEERIMAKADVEKDLLEDVWKRIRNQVENLKYGTVTITVHDGKITQIETSSKERF
ncbi:YezD family protein [Butyrivibrio sp. AD3002]|uniref:YezD family protein n=2 Tax=Butyrivibrio TaxID=830 RepID=UPI0004235411|nr:YezD family protein [Butyrivibrio sp. AD3002]